MPTESSNGGMVLNGGPLASTSSAVPQSVTSAPSNDAHQNKKPGFFVGCLLPLLVLLAIVIAFQVITNRPESQERQDNTATSAEPQKSEAELFDETMSADGWKVVTSGETYWRWPTEEEKSGASCGYYACSDVLISSKNGCPSGFYVKGDIMSGETPVDWTNEISAGVAPGEVVVVRLEDHQGIGTAFRISEIQCMG